MKNIFRFLLVSFGAVLMAVNINTFVHTGGLLTDFIPGFYVTDDILLCAVFGGILNGIAVCLCLFAGATSGGTDFEHTLSSLSKIHTFYCHTKTNRNC